LIANHGSVVVDKTLERAVEMASLLELMAQQYYLALQLGDVALLSDEEMKEAKEQFERPDFGYSDE